MIYELALSEAERNRIIKNLRDEAENGTEFDKQVLEAFTRGSINNTESQETQWATDVIIDRNNRYRSNPDD